MHLHTHTYMHTVIHTHTYILSHTPATHTQAHIHTNTLPHLAHALSGKGATGIQFPTVRAVQS